MRTTAHHPGVVRHGYATPIPALPTNWPYGALLSQPFLTQLAHSDLTERRRDVIAGELFDFDRVGERLGGSLCGESPLFSLCVLRCPIADHVTARQRMIEVLHGYTPATGAVLSRR